MRTVTYGVSGLIDWKAQIQVGRARLSVHFTGGAITKYGVTPAEYTTSDPITQRIIEDSDYCRSGKIRILRSTGRQEPVALSRKSDMATRAAYEAATLPFDSPHTQPIANVQQGGADQLLSFKCLEDARQYMIDNYGVASLSITTLANINNIAAEHGFTVTIDKP